MVSDEYYGFSQELLEKKGYWINIKSYYLLELTKMELSGHRHQKVEIMYVSKGSCSINLSDKSVHLNKDNYIIINAGVWHGLTIKTDDCCIINIEFVFSRCDTSFSIEDVKQFNKPLTHILPPQSLM